MKYEYKLLEEPFELGDVNRLGADGWRLVVWNIQGGGVETALFERAQEIATSKHQ